MSIRAWSRELPLTLVWGTVGKARLRAALACVAVGALITTPSPASSVAGFEDVVQERFYTAAVQWMVDEAIARETTTGCFRPEQPASRAEVAVFIHRFAGEPSGGTEPFTDVEPDDRYADAVAWMYNAEITVGTGPETFSPQRPATRAEFAAFLHRFAGEPAGAAEPFSDVDRGTWFAGPIAWMFAAGVTTGTSAVTFSPHRFVTRAEVATFLHRFAGEPVVETDASGVCENTFSSSTSSAEAEVPPPSTSVAEPEVPPPSTSVAEEDVPPPSTSVAEEDVPPSPAALAEAESLMLLNELRASLGLRVLERDLLMDAYARNWSREMHDMARVQHSAGPYSENVAWWSASGATPEEAALRLHSLWLDSGGHYANMIDGSYSSVGVGFWNGPGGWFVTHVFSAS